MEVEELTKRYGGLPRAVVLRAQEYYRLTRAKKSAALDQFAGPVACLVLAAQALDEQVDKAKLTRHASTSARTVNASIRKVLNAVDVRAVVKTSAVALCIKFGCEALTDTVSQVLNEYRAHLGKMKNAGKVDPQDPTFVAACLYATSRHAKMNVNRDKLLAAVCGNPKSFDAIVSSIEANCQASLGGAITNRRKRRSSPSEEARLQLVAQQQKEQDEEEVRVKRLKQDASRPTRPQTSSQQRLLEKLKASRGTASPSKSTESSQETVGVATPEEYAAWRAQALDYMRQRKEEQQQRREQSNSVGKRMNPTVAT